MNKSRISPQKIILIFTEDIEKLCDIFEEFFRDEVQI